MLTVIQALGTLSWRLILAIGRGHGLGLDSNLKKDELIYTVSRHLLDPNYLPGAVANRPAGERQLLAELLLAGGHLPAPFLTPTYGRRRPNGALLIAYRRQQPLSVIEQLCLLGLIFFEQKSDRLYIPTDLQPLLPQPEALPPPTAGPALAEAPADQLVYDLTLLLALLHREDIQPLHGRWLPPTFLNEWGRRCRVVPAVPGAGGELQTGRRRFLHYLAETAGLLSGPQPALSGPGDKAQAEEGQPFPALLKPTPAAWLWLAAPPAERLQQVWSAWSRPSPELWRRYRLPGAAWLAEPAALLEPLHRALTQLEPAEPLHFAGMFLQHQPDLPTLLPATIPDRQELLAGLIAELLSGPLLWLGWLQPAHPDRPNAGKTPSAPLALSPQGLAWLTGRPLPASPPGAKFGVKTDFHEEPLKSRLTLSLSGGWPEPADLMAAIEISRPETEAEAGQAPLSGREYRITAATFIRASQRGRPAAALVEALNRLAERPLAGPETALLFEWAKAANRVTLQPVMLLETTDPGVITRLASSRRGRAFIRRTLSPRAVTVDPSRLVPLVRRLAEQEGIPPQLVAPAAAIGQSQLPAALLPHAAYLRLALVIYQRLGRHIHLPAPLPQALLDQLSPHLSAADLAATEIAIEQTLAALQQALEGRTPFPPWPEGGLPVEQSLAVIEQALAAGQNLRLLYQTPTRDPESWLRRTVEPHRVEWHGETPYLIGFCQEAQAGRTFRLDRIREIEPVENLYKNP